MARSAQNVTLARHASEGEQHRKSCKYSPSLARRASVSLLRWDIFPNELYRCAKHATTLRSVPGHSGNGT